MSYDVGLRADLGGPEMVNLGLFWNYTTNCAPMWRAAGADLQDFNGKRAGDCAPILWAAIQAMRTDPAKYRAMDPDNGWGSYDTLLPRLEELLAWFQKAPMAFVDVSW